MNIYMEYKRLPKVTVFHGYRVKEYMRDQFCDTIRTHEYDFKQQLFEKYLLFRDYVHINVR